MDIQRVNSTLNRAIVALQADEIEAMAEAMAGTYRVPSPSQVGKYQVPSPSKFGFTAEKPQEVKPAKSVAVKSELIGKGKARVGMMLGNWRVVKATKPRVTVEIESDHDLGYRSRGKTLTYTWDGVGYIRQGQYLHTDGIHQLPGGKPIDHSKMYPEGTVIQSMEKWTWIIVGKGKPRTDWKGNFDGYAYPVKKSKGKKTFEMTVSARGDVNVYDGSKRVGLMKVTVRPPR